MIEDYQAKRRRARIVQRSLLATGLVLALVSALLTYYFASRAPAADPGITVATTQVLVARRDIPVRTILTADDVQVVQTTAGVVPAGALRQPGDAIGRVATQPIAANEIIHASRFTDSVATNFAIFPAGEQASGSTPDFRAMSLNIPNTHAVGGSIRAGDRVDILFALVFVPGQLGTGTNLEQDYAARILAENVAVLAKDEVASIYTFRVEAAQAERIASIQAAGGTIHLLLRAANDARAPRASGSVYSSEAGRIIRAIPTSSPGPTTPPR